MLNRFFSIQKKERSKMNTFNKDDSKYEYKFINKKLVLSNEKGIFTFVKK